MLTCIAVAGVLAASIEITAPETVLNLDTMEEESSVPTRSFLVPIEGVTAINFTTDGSPDLKLKFEYIENGEHRYWDLWVPIEPGTPLTLTDFLLTCPKAKVQL